MKIESKIHRNRANSGFTLIEMMLVLGIIALLVGAGVVRLKGVSESAKGTAAQADISALVSAVRMYSLQAGRFPTNEQGLRALSEKPTIPPQPKRWIKSLESEDLFDPWEREYKYRYPGMDGREFDVYSFGADGIESDDDIGNWK